MGLNSERLYRIWKNMKYRCNDRMMCKFNRCGICFNCYSKHFNNDCFPCEDADPMTNADRIRAMSDEELAEFLIDLADDGNLRIREWLQQPAEEDDHE